MTKQFFCPPCDAESAHGLVGEYDSEEFHRKYSIYECERCCSKRSHPFLTDAELTEYYTDEGIMGAGKYEKWRGKYKYIHHWINGRIKVHGIRVVEIGSSSGNLLRYFKEHSDCEVLGVELSSRCREYSENINGVPVFPSTFEDYVREHEQEADLVVMIHAFEHIPEPVALLQSITASLRDRGYIYIEIPNSRMIDWDLLKNISNPLCIPFHSYLYNQKSIRALLENQGFNVVAERRWSRKEDTGSVSISIAEFIRRSFENALGKTAPARYLSGGGRALVRFYPIRVLLTVLFMLLNKSTTIAVLARKSGPVDPQHFC